MTKMSKGEIVSTEVLMKVCQVLHCNVGDIVDFIEKPISDAEENKEEQSVLD